MTSYYLGGIRRAGGGLAMALLTLIAATTARAQSVTIDFVTVGSLNNANDPQTNRGAVGYQYQIGTYEVTNSQYAAFLNAVAKSDPYALYSTEMGSDAHGGITRSGSAGSYSYTVKPGYENKPVVYTSWWDAARFANWVGTGDTEGMMPGGAYQLNGGFPSGVVRQPNAVVALPTQDEWYKAAYFDPLKGGTGGYHIYPTGTNAVPNSALPGPGANRANFWRVGSDPVNDPLNLLNNGYAVTDSPTLVLGTLYLSSVGAFSDSASALGTFDQGGNVWEWNETLQGAGDGRGVRGGSWYDGEATLISTFGTSLNATIEAGNVGFRVASLAPIPEPSTYAAIAGLMSLGVAMWRRRAGRGRVSA